MTFLHDRCSLGCQKESESSSEDNRLTLGTFLRGQSPLLRMNAPTVESGAKRKRDTKKGKQEVSHEIFLEEIRCGRRLRIMFYAAIQFLICTLSVDTEVLNNALPSSSVRLCILFLLTQVIVRTGPSCLGKLNIPRNRLSSPSIVLCRNRLFVTIESKILSRGCIRAETET